MFNHNLNVYTVSALFIQSPHYSLPKHFTITSLSSGDLILHVFMTPFYHLIQGLHLFLLPSTLESYTFFCQTFSTHTLHIAKPLQNLSIYSINQLFSHINSKRHFLIPPSIRTGYYAHFPYILCFHNNWRVFLTSYQTSSFHSTCQQWHNHSFIKLLRHIQLTLLTIDLIYN